MSKPLFVFSILAIITCAGPAEAAKRYLEVYESSGNEEFPVYDKENPDFENDKPVMFLKPGDLLPEGRRRGSQYVIETKGGDPLYIPRNFVRRARRASGRRLHLDGELSTAYTMADQPGKTYQDCWDIETNKDAKVPCKAWPTAGDNATNLEFADSEVVRFHDPLEGRDVTRIFYKANGTYFPKKLDEKGKSYYDSQAKKIDSLWIDSKNIRYTPLGKSVDLSRCPPDPRGDGPGMPRSRKDFEDIAKQMSDNLYLGILPHVGKCIQNQSGVPGLRQHWSQRTRQRDPANLTVAGAKISPLQLEAIDVLARVVFGEMRSCANIGLQYPMTVARVALNRADLARERRPNSSIFPLPNKKGIPGAPVEEAMIKVLGTPLQFSALNRNDSNLSKVMCPTKPTKRKGFDPSVEAWKRSVKVAAMTILDTKEFKEKTNSIKVFHYTSAIKAPWKGAKRVSASVDGYAVDNASCIRLWKLGSAQALWMGSDLEHYFAQDGRPFSIWDNVGP